MLYLEEFGMTPEGNRWKSGYGTKAVTMTHNRSFLKTPEIIGEKVGRLSSQFPYPLRVFQGYLRKAI